METMRMLHRGTYDGKDLNLMTKDDQDYSTICKRLASLDKTFKQSCISSLISYANLTNNDHAKLSIKSAGLKFVIHEMDKDKIVMHVSMYPTAIVLPYYYEYKIYHVNNHKRELIYETMDRGEISDVLDVYALDRLNKISKDFPEGYLGGYKKVKYLDEDNTVDCVEQYRIEYQKINGKTQEYTIAAEDEFVIDRYKIQKGA